MGAFKIEVDGVGGHGCSREAKEGERVYGCNRMGCPDCLARDFVELLGRRGFMGVKGTFTHWPGEPTQVVDAIEVAAGYATVTRKSGQF